MQLRTVLAAAVVGLGLLCMAELAAAQQIYKWKDPNGVTHFSQTPPTNGTHYTKMQLTSGPEVSSNPPPSAGAASKPEPAAAPQTQAAAAQATQPDTPANREQLCKQLGSNIAVLESKQPVVTGDASGKQSVMSDDAREQQLATAKAQQSQYCAGH
ncbi:MAG: DUF4124 domain-containing protein [Rhodanobacteraceae bacterium]